MKIFRNLTIVTAIIAILSLITSAILEFVVKKYSYNIISYMVNINIGIFSSSLLLLVNGIVGYKIEEKSSVVKLNTLINKIYNLQGIIDYKIPNKVDVSDNGCKEKMQKHNETIYLWLVDVLEILFGDILLTELNMKFICRCGKKQKQYEKVKTLMSEFGKYIIEYRQKLHETNKSDFSDNQKFDAFERLNHNYMSKIEILENCMFEVGELREMCGYGKNLLKKGERK